MKTTVVRFFTKEKLLCEYEYAIPVPQIDTYVWLLDEPYKVQEITYLLAETEEDYSMIDITVKKVDVIVIEESTRFSE